MKCVYCGSAGPFNKEHVIPQFLGAFTPTSPTITASDGLVCTHCNSVIFSGLETEFREDSYEGITGQMLNLTGSNSVRIRGQNVKMEAISGMGDQFFDEMFPFLRPEDGTFVVAPKSQVKVRNYGGEFGYQVFSLDALQRIKDESFQSAAKLADFNRVKDRLKMSGTNNIAVFVGGSGPEDGSELDQAIALLGEFGVKYRERERKFAPIDQVPQPKFEVQMQCAVTPNIRRFIAKVAFNYFVFSALQDQQEAILYNSSFDQIKRFVLGGARTDDPPIITQMSNDPITYHEKQSGRRFLGHTIVFYQENGRIYSRLSFLGCKVYTVDFGEALPEFLVGDFGCGHLFNPIDHSIHNLTQQPKVNPTEEELKQSFGLFRRIDLTN